MRKKRSAAARKKKQMPKKKISFFAKTAFFVFLFFCGITMFQMGAQIQAAREEIAEANRQIADYQAQIQALNDELDTPFDYTYIRKIARSKLNYSMPDDVVFYNDLSN